MASSKAKGVHVMAEKTTLGVVGCGGFCRGNHIPNLLSNPLVRLKSLCDLNTDGLEEYGTDVVTTDMEELFADPEIQGVVCATKPDARFEAMELAKKFRKPLFVEKPLCWGEEQTFKAVDMMREHSGLIFVGFNREFSPLMQDAKKAFLERCTSGNTTIIYRIIGESYLWPQHHYTAVVDRKESTIVHEVTHIFRLMHFFTGTYPVSVNTSGGGNMDNIITLEYPGDITVVIIAGDNSNAGFPKEYLEINGNHTTIAGYNFTELEVTGNDGTFIRNRYAYTIAGKPYITGRIEAEERKREFRFSVTEEERAYGYYYHRQPKVDKGHSQEMEFFRRCAAGITPSPINLFDGAAANILAYRAIKSHKQAQRIALNIPGELGI